MSELTKALTRLSNWLRGFHPHGESFLQPALTHQEIEDKTATLPFKLPVEVYELYQWHNGTEDDLLRLMLFPLPLEEALQVYQEVVEEGESVVNPIWDSSWFPIFSDEGKAYYLVSGSIKQKDDSPVLEFSEAGTSLAYSNLTAMMLTVSECLEERAYCLSETGRSLDMNYLLVKAIHEKHNPGITY